MASKPERLLDDIGWNILTALQENARSSFNDLGRRVGLSAPAAAERVRRMEEAGIIIGYRVALAVDKLGYPITALLRISAPEENCVRLGAAARTLPEVVESHRVTGHDRLLLKVSAASVNHLDKIIEELSRYGTVTAAIVLASRTTTVARPSPSSGVARARQAPRA